MAQNASVWSPGNKYLVWELERFPLSRPEWAHETLVPRLTEALTGDAARVVQSLFVELEPHARAAGHGPTIDEWGAELTLIRGVLVT